MATRVSWRLRRHGAHSSRNQIKVRDHQLNLSSLNHRNRSSHSHLSKRQVEEAQSASMDETRMGESAALEASHSHRTTREPHLSQIV